MEPAYTIISALGGTVRVAALRGVGRTAVWKWTQPREKGGTGGLIPIEHIRPLLDVLRAEGHAFTAEDFLPPPSDLAPPPAAPAAVQPEVST